MMLDKNILDMIEYPKQGILSKDLEKNDKINLTLFCMAEGTNISDHTSTKGGFVYVIEGEGSFKLEGKDIAMKSGVFIYMDENAVHSLKATKNIAFILALV
ncbi:MAG: cupin domain-containing protein [Candidatus Altiarchaeota archaeon]|nr:cupin domain-containing protein [Candidatus Altiarchaeota archaeon]